MVASRNANVKTGRRCILGSLLAIGRSERDYIRAREPRGVLVAPDAVAYGRSGDFFPGAEMPQRRTGPRVQRSEDSLVVPGKQKPAGGREQPGTITIGPDLLVFPSQLAGGHLQSPHVVLPAFFLLRTFDVAG